MCTLKFIKSYACTRTQFCIAGLRESSPEEPKMHQNCWRPRLCPGPHWGAYSAPPPDSLVGGEGALTPSPRIPLPAQPFELWPFGSRLAPAMLISFRRHCWILSQILSFHDFFWGGTGSPFGCVLVSLGQSLACVNTLGAAPSKGRNIVSRKKSIRV